jgi:hypothetical protein
MHFAWATKMWGSWHCTVISRIHQTNPMNTPTSVPPNNDPAQANFDALPKQMLLVDALRGFDMF